MGSISTLYAASSNVTVTNLHGIASSATWVAGWESGAIDNTSAGYADYLISGKLVAESSGLSAGEMRIYVVGMLDDSNWHSPFDGTESTVTITDTEFRDSICKLGAAIVTDTGASDVYPFGPFSVASLFGGVCPAKFVIFITQSTGTTLETSGNQVTVKGVYYSVA